MPTFDITSFISSLTTNIFIDKNLNRYNIIYAAAGHPHVVFGIKFDDLVNFSKGKVKDITI